MAKRTEHFQCPCCNMHAPIERITEEGPFEFALFEKILGGKTALTTEEKEEQIKRGYRHFQVPGNLDYNPIPMTGERQEQMARRIEELVASPLEVQMVTKPRKPTPPPPVEAPEVTEKDPQGLLTQISTKWEGAKSRNSTRAENDLDNLEEAGFEVGDARAALEEYTGLERSDFSDAEEFSEARTEAWQEFVDALTDMKLEEK